MVFTCLLNIFPKLINALDFDIDFEYVFSFITRYIWVILLIVFGVIILLKINTIVLIIASIRTKLSKKEKKAESEVKYYKKDSKDKKNVVIDVEYKITEEKNIKAEK